MTRSPIFSSSPRALSDAALERVGVRMLLSSHLLLECKRCGEQWSPTISSGGHLRAGFWRCPNGCNRLARRDEGAEMGLKRLPRDPAEQKRWARHVAASVRIPPLACVVAPRESREQFYQRIFSRALEIGAEVALQEVLAELERSDDWREGLPPHLVKSAEAAARTRRRRAAGSRRKRSRAA